MSGSVFSTAGIENQLQLGNQILSQILASLRSGVAIQDIPPVYTVSTLPGVGSPGQYAWASNGRKPGEGIGSGTGVPVFFNSATNTWFSYLSGLAVTA